MPLSNSQLLITDMLIYTDHVADGRTVGDILNNVEASGFDAPGASPAEWKKVISNARKDENFLNYRVTNYREESNGFRAACFVDDVSKPEDINVSFRGTSTDFEMHDNGTGAYVSDSALQKTAADYVISLPEGYGDSITVTGHSKGGNEAQYVTVVTDRVSNCVSFDGQGFSKEFLEKYGDRIELQKGRIASISASNDIVNPLLIPVAGTNIYIETAEQSDPFTGYHQLSILLDENGNFNKQVPQSLRAKMVNEYTEYIINNMDMPEKQIVIDGLVSFLESGDNRKESAFQQIISAADAVTHIDDFAINYIGNTFGLAAKKAATYLSAMLFPVLSVDNYISAAVSSGKKSALQCVSIIDGIVAKLKSYKKVRDALCIGIISAVKSFFSRIDSLFFRNINTGYRSSVSNTVQLNTANLYSYADRLRNVSGRLSALENRVRDLQRVTGMNDLSLVIRFDMIGRNCWKIKRYEDYCRRTASDFENTERIIMSKM